MFGYQHCPTSLDDGYMLLPLRMNFLTLTTTFTFPASPLSGGVNGLGGSMTSIGSLLLRLGALAVLWYVAKSGVVIAR